MNSNLNLKYMDILVMLASESEDFDMYSISDLFPKLAIESYLVDQPAEQSGKVHSMKS